MLIIMFQLPVSELVFHLLWSTWKMSTSFSLKISLYLKQFRCTSFSNEVVLCFRLNWPELLPPLNCHRIHSKGCLDASSLLWVLLKNGINASLLFSHNILIQGPKYTKPFQHQPGYNVSCVLWIALCVSSCV